MEKKSKIGMEIELGLRDSKGYVQNAAPKILSDPRGAGWLVYEGTHQQVEINSAPTETIHELARDLHAKQILLEEICADYQGNQPISPVSVSEFGAGRGKSNDRIARIPFYEAVIKEECLAEILTLSGGHIHLDQEIGKEVKQSWLFTGLDALSYAITSTSPITYDGTNNINCHRVNTTRHGSFESHPLSAQLQPYASSLEEIQSRITETYQHWQSQANESGLTDFEENFTEENTGYAPIRHRPTFGTWEIRSFDTAPLDILLAAAALYKGMNDYMLKNDVEVIVSEEDETYYFSNEQFFLPSHGTVLQMEKEATLYGLKDNNNQESGVRQYLEAVLPFAEAGLPKEDKKYLNPIKEMINSQHNLADEIMLNLKGKEGYKQEEKIPPKLAAQVNLFMRDRYLQGLETVQRYL